MAAIAFPFRLLLIASLLAGPATAPAQRQEREAASAEGLSEVGKGKRLARQELKPGAYITPRHRQAVQAWRAGNQGPGQGCLPGQELRGDGCARAAGGPAWKIGTPLPARVRLDALPPGLAKTLPPAPPGNRYVLLAGDILLIATASRIVVDAVPASP